MSRKGYSMVGVDDANRSTMSATPRTDALYRTNGGIQKMLTLKECEDHAAKLERKNTALNADARRYRWLNLNWGAFVQRTDWMFDSTSDLDIAIDDEIAKDKKRKAQRA